MIVDEYLTPGDIQRILGFSKQKTYDLINQNDFPKIKIGRNYRIPSSEFDKFMKKYLYKEIEII
jgi:excisionase family DNA binding protein